MGGKRLTTEEVKRRIYSLESDNYKLLSEYVNAKTKVKIKHVVCGFEYEVKWNNFYHGNRCPKCAILTLKNKLAFTNEDIVKAMYKLVGDEYTKLDDSYSNARTKFPIRHNLCGCEYGVSWDAFQRSGSRCPKCAGNYRYTNNEISELVSEMTNGEYTKLSEYKNNHTKFKMRHNLCGHVYMIEWGSFQQGVRCPKCNSSKGEKGVMEYLKNKNIKFIREFRFADCRYKRPLPFDFAILDSEKKIAALIEYNGQQHYIPVEHWGGEQTLKEVQLRDQIKDDYCKEHNIPLLRIRYDEDIEEKLRLFLNQETERKV